MTGARSPEELEQLLEDAFVVEDSETLVRLFEHDAVLGTGLDEACGGEEIGRLAAAAWSRGYRYLGSPQRVLEARDTALLVAPHGINVAHRRRDGEWRYAISLLDEGGGR